MENLTTKERITKKQSMLTIKTIILRSYNRRSTSLIPAATAVSMITFAENKQQFTLNMNKQQSTSNKQATSHLH